MGVKFSFNYYYITKNLFKRWNHSRYSRISNIRKRRTKNIHAKYNDAIHKLNRDFQIQDKIKILIIGNSFARDWCNVLLESKYSSQIEISCIYEPVNNLRLDPLVRKVDIIFVSRHTKQKLKELNISETKVWCIGTKKFGINNGIYYNYSGDNYCSQRTKMEKGYI